MGCLFPTNLKNHKVISLITSPFYFTLKNLHLFIYACVYMNVCDCWGVCRGQRTTCGNRHSFTMWVLETKLSGHQVWWQVSLPSFIIISILKRLQKKKMMIHGLYGKLILYCFSLPLPKDTCESLVISHRLQQNTVITRLPFQALL